MAKTFVIGDIHGAYKALIQCLERSSFDYNEDKLIFLGDICDGWPETELCFKELLKIKNFIYVLGNHDLWLLKWAKTGKKDYDWLMNCASSTFDHFPSGLNEEYIKFLETAKPYHIEGNKLFVHAGIDPQKEIEKQDQDTFLWDRNLPVLMLKYLQGKSNKKISNIYDAIYIGHSPTIVFKTTKPISYAGVWMLDTGAGWNGVLTIMNIETNEYFSSDLVTDLYPNVNGRLN